MTRFESDMCHYLPFAPTPAYRGRRGVLLLVVLSMLTLFMMLGTAYLVTTTRARDAALANARLTFGGDAARVPHARLLDAVMLRIVQGGRAPIPSNRSLVSNTAAFSTLRFESLLADKYGGTDRFGTLATLTGSCSAVSTSGPYLAATVSLNGSSLRPGMKYRPTDLVGRLLTFCESGRPVTTHRIIRASGMPGGVVSTTNSLVLTNSTSTPVLLTLAPSLRTGPATLPRPGRIIVNGREFSGQPTPGYAHTPAGYRGHLVTTTNPANEDGLAGRAIPSNESWDGFDAHNGSLSQLQPTSAISSSNLISASWLAPPSAGTGFTLSGTMPYSYAQLTSGGSFDYDNDLIPDAADNDGDGTYDGVFLDWGFPTTNDTYGNTIELRASALVIDLDSRFNINAHGSLAPVLYTRTHNGWSDHPSLPREDANSNGLWDEDQNQNGALDPGEDMNGNNTLDDLEDTNKNGKLDDYRLAPLGGSYGPAEIQANVGFGNEPKRGRGSTVNRMFDAAVLTTGATAAISENPKLFTIVGGRPSNQTGKRPSDSRYSAGQLSPQLAALEGKYGKITPNDWQPLSPTVSMPALPYALPGQPSTDDAASRMNDRRAPPGANARINYGIPPRWWTGTSGFSWADDGTTASPRGIFNSPPDLHGRMLSFTVGPASGAIIPKMAFAKAEWSNGLDSTDDPYEQRLDTRQGWGGWLNDPGTSGLSTGTLLHNPFTLSELEPILRPYDIDTNRLPPRLAAMMGSAAEYVRLRLTTDSWDSTALLGSGTSGQPGAAEKIFGWLQNVTAARLYGFNEDVDFDGILDPGEDLNGNGFLDPPPLTGAISGEIARGERFDLNRPFQEFSTANSGYNVSNFYYVHRQAYFKDLYTLLYAISDEDANGNGSLDPGEDSNGNGIADPVGLIASALAQWAANVVEFRDADSRITPFEYDLNPKNGWDVDGDVTTNEGGDRRLVWGAERPEILIRETLAWENVDSGTTGGVFIALHRPWNAVAYGSGSTAALDAEPCDVSLDTPLGGTGRPTNVVDLGRKPSSLSPSGTNNLYGDGSANRYPIWRLRLVSGAGTSYVRLDTGTTSTPTLFVSATVSPTGTSAANGDLKPKLGVDQTLTLFGSTAIKSGTSTVTVNLTSGSHAVATSSTVAFRVPGLPSGPSRNATVYLERLSNPAVELNQGTPAHDAVWTADPLAPDLISGTVPWRYVVVDSGSLSVINTGTSASGPGPLNSLVRSGTNPNTAFWRPTFELSGSSPTSFPTTISGSFAQWFAWPNRPFVSAAELLLVPQGNTLEMLQQYRVPQITGTNQGSVGVPGVPVPLHLFFDAVQVPSRFSGVNATCVNDYFGVTGISTITTPVGQLPSYREPGRVNLNTVVSDDVWNAVVGLTASGTLLSSKEILVDRNIAQFSGTLPQASNAARTLAGMMALSSTASGTSTVGFVTGSFQTGSSGAATITSLPTLSLNRNPVHAISTLSRLANTVTPRSNVFAIWITLRESIAGDPDSVKYRRAFYIVDRSIPVGYEPGEDLDGDGFLDPPEDVNGNGIMDSGEDRGNGFLDPTEDLNSNSRLDPGEDVNGNGALDSSEDANNNGQLDAGEDRGDGVLDAGEDRNGNGILDPANAHNVWDCVRLRRVIE